jgi:hypothetical protein
MMDEPTFSQGARVRANDPRNLQYRGGTIEALENHPTRGPRVTVRWDYSGETTKIATRRFGRLRNQYTQTTEGKG